MGVGGVSNNSKEIKMKLNIHSKEYKKKQKVNSRYIKELRKKATKAEIIVKQFLESSEVYFIFQKGFLNPFHRIADFYLPAPIKLIIEIDGEYHLQTKERDFLKDRIWLLERGIRTIRITNRDVFNGKFEEWLRKLI